jgi:hypothetical protein
MMPNDATKLLPVLHGNVTSCHKQNVKFVWVKLRLNFSSLANASVMTHSCILLEEYYIELPQTTEAMTHANGQAYNLTT